ncbi:capsular polysaccharide synthesis protein [Bifidobacterium panos]|uniref:Capsular polysaccharide synthesis protein n=1 Tax=Bifidobacterium panos TaxID=2675321 RepID=A0ABX1T012_9BIFI|nr:capsular polysaccharide synthesis protein [Bifidobacterium sp. DSM 109963]NMN02473.1 capsular polysaccharide synthesis protein [Bifidobacterium sp. DSM 109963]
MTKAKAEGSQFRRFTQHARLFGLKYAWLEVICHVDYKVAERLKIPAFGRLFSSKEHWLTNWCRTYFQQEIDKYIDAGSAAAPNIANDEIVWTCWLQGEENAPAFIKALMRRVKEHGGEHAVVVITNENYQQYCQLPSEICRKYADEIISPQQMTDIIRAALLAKHGGLWLDATVLVTDIPAGIFDLPTYTVKGIRSDFFESLRIPVPSEWMSYCIASKPNSVTYRFIYDCLIHYWLEFNTLIDYFLVFYCAQIARNSIPAARAEYDAIPVNNTDCEMLLPLLRDSVSYNSSEVKTLLNGSTWAFKLSWKENLPSFTEEGDKTLVGWISEKGNGQ